MVPFLHTHTHTHVGPPTITVSADEVCEHVHPVSQPYCPDLAVYCPFFIIMYRLQVMKRCNLSGLSH